MSDIRKHLYNACDPMKPASAEYYVDCSDVRGSNAMAGRFIEALTLTDEFKCLLFSGHLGCGKSSELVHLSQKLAESVRGRKRYFPILMRSGDYLDPYDVTPTDLLLAVVAEVAATLREELKIELHDSYFQKRLDELKRFFLTEVEIESGEVSLSGVKAKIQRLQKDPDARKMVRESLLPQMTTVLNEINAVFDDARIKIKKAPHGATEQPFHDFVLIIDDLEKIQRVSGQDEGSASHRELFIDRAPMLRNLNAHVVYTVPLSLVRAHGSNLRTIYGRPPFVLPMIKVETRRGHAHYEPGRERLKDLLVKRAGKTSLQDVIEPDAIDFLITYSGGHVRNFLSSIQQAMTYVESLPITRTAARNALKEDINVMAASVRAGWWVKLAALERSQTQDVDNNDPDTQEMLEQNFVLEYLNGNEDSDEIVADAPWYGVHPILRDLPQFRTAVRLLSEPGVA